MKGNNKNPTSVDKHHAIPEREIQHVLHPPSNHTKKQKERFIAKGTIYYSNRLIVGVAEQDQETSVVKVR